MAKYSKFNIIYLIQKWMDSVAGQTFMNYAYSWGASIVILGTLFKLTHLPGANIMLFIGMGTEVFVFFIAAFDRPFDKTADGRDLATDSQLAAQLAGMEGGDAMEQMTVNGAAIAAATAAEGQTVTAAVAGAAPIIIGGGGGMTSANGSMNADAANANAATAQTEAQQEFQGESSGTVILGTAPVIGAPAPAVSP